MICPYCKTGKLEYVGGYRNYHYPSVNLVCQNRGCSIKTWYRCPNHIPNEQINKYFNKKGTANEKCTDKGYDKEGV